ncbi:MAG TPA: hypothetical protein VMD91_14610 [Candidatus Sulfotelmatobacter sp.]|nr:hypothetical protein [Candidatus Sulfotelmatobacter sp.]
MLLALALAAATPAPSVPAVPRTSVVCARADLWLWPANATQPVRAAVPPATLGTRFTRLAGPRIPLGGEPYVETDVPALEPGHRGEFYWLRARCAADEG